MDYVVVAHWIAREGQQEAVAAALAKLIGPSRGEPGNLEYQVHRDPADPCHFFLYERYVDADAYAAHGQSEHFLRHGVQEGIPLLASRERNFYVTWDGN